MRGGGERPEAGQAKDDGASGRVRRREFLLTGAAAAALTAPGAALAAKSLNHAALARERRLPFAREGAFRSGVASGFPNTEAITLWTRLHEVDRSSLLTLEVARERDFRRVVERRTVAATAANDFTVHAQVRKLRPRREYFYRFATRGSHSPVGRFRTAPPPDSREPVRIGFCACQKYAAGYYAAHRALADEPDLDLVVFLGDYIYEKTSAEGPPERRDTIAADKDGKVQTLKEYRRKYRFYQSDRQLQAMHAAHPFVAIWDDHEVENDYAGTRPHAGSKDPAKLGGRPRRVPFEQRRRNGYRAFFEANPRLIPRHGSRIYQRARIGSLVDLLLLDERQYRDLQPCENTPATPCPEAQAPGRMLLGVKQKAWLKRRLTESRATWKLLGNQVMMMGLNSAPGQPLNQDQWDGYAAERRELMEHVLANRVENVVALTGDIHSYFAGTVTTTGDVTGTPAATELIGGSITSATLADGFSGSGPIGSALLRSNPHIAYSEFEHHGYAVATVEPDELRCEFRAVESIDNPGSPAFTLASFRVREGQVGVEEA